MRRPIVALSVLAVLALLLVGFELRQSAKETAPLPAASASSTGIKLPPPGVTFAPVPWAKPIIAPKPGAPRAFPTSFREQTVAYYQGLLTAKLGADFPLDKRVRVAKIQNQFWDEQGANVDAFEDHRISQPEFADRTHTAMAHWVDKFAQLLTPEEHMKLFDVPPGTDVYPLLFHSANEQPGMPVNVYDRGDEPPPAELAKLQAPATPPPTGPRQTPTEETLLATHAAASTAPAATGDPSASPPPPPPSSGTSK